MSSHQDDARKNRLLTDHPTLKVKFWVCPITGHSHVARCLAPGCRHTSQKGHPS